jgi:hypothetical protein
MSAVVVGCVFGGAMIGMALRAVIPEHHMNADTKDVIKLGIGLIGTMTALVLGLLVASAKGSYDTRRSELTQMAANTVLLDRALAHYGPETAEIRQRMKRAVAEMIDQIWPKDSTLPGGLSARAGAGEAAFDEVQALVPKTDAQRSIQSQVESIMINIGQTRWLLFEQSGSSISMPFLVVVAFWLSVLFVSFGLFAPRNGTVVVTLLISALSVAGALFLILELDRPFSGMIQISSAPMHTALAALGK